MTKTDRAIHRYACRWPRPNYRDCKSTVCNILCLRLGEYTVDFLHQRKYNHPVLPLAKSSALRSHPLLPFHFLFCVAALCQQLGLFLKAHFELQNQSNFLSTCDSNLHFQRQGLAAFYRPLSATH